MGFRFSRPARRTAAPATARAAGNQGAIEKQGAAKGGA